MKIRDKLRKLRKSWDHATPYQRGLSIVLIGNLALYAYVISQFPDYISDQVIYSIGSVLLNVEGFLLALTSQIHQSERKFAVVVGLVAILFSVITIAKAYFESIQLKYLSYAPTTSLFDSDVILFGLFVGTYAVSILYPEGPKERATVGQ